VTNNLLSSGSVVDLLEGLSLLAREKSSEKRRELLSNVADLFYSGPADVHTELEVQIFADVVVRLLKDVNLSGRAAFSDRAATDERTPRQVALTLANDAIEVAQSVLTHSPTLSDSDLVAIASTKTVEHRLAISKRDYITETVSDTLLGFDEIEITESLTDNATAAISAQGFSRISTLALDRPSLRRKLSVREDLPLAIANEILPYMSADESEKLLKLMGVEGSKGLNALLEKATPELIAQRGAKARRHLSIKGMMKSVALGEASLDAVIEQLVEGGKVLEVAFGLSLASDLPEQQVANAIMSVRMEPLAVICKSLDIRVATYLAVDALRTQSVHLPELSTESLKLAYGKLTLEAAARSLRFVKVRNTLSAGS